MEDVPHADMKYVSLSLGEDKGGLGSASKPKVPSSGRHACGAEGASDGIGVPTANDRTAGGDAVPSAAKSKTGSGDSEEVVRDDTGVPTTNDGTTG